MIGYLRGKIIEKNTGGIILDVSNVGYDVESPLSTLCQLPPVGEEASLWIFTHVREDAFRLFGFASAFDKKVFEALISVSSVGPKSALGLLGPLNGEELLEAILEGDLNTLVSVPGVGMKTAERLVLELKSKAQKLVAQLGDSSEGRIGATRASQAEPQDGKVPQALASRRVLEDLRSALSNLGYKDKQVNDVVREYEERGRQGETLVIEAVLREVLRKFSGRVVTTSQ